MTFKLCPTLHNAAMRLAIVTGLETPPKILILAPCVFTEHSLTHFNLTFMQRYYLTQQLGMYFITRNHR